MVNRPLILKWVDALNSGKYRQIRGFLRTDEGFDVLGVLCDVVDPEGWDVAKPYKCPRGTYYGYMYKNQLSTYILPPALVDDLGVEDNFCYWVVELNDKKTIDFENMANTLERLFLVS